MNLFQQLFSDWVGILSLFTVAFVLSMGTYLFFYVRRHMVDDAPRPKAR